MVLFLERSNVELGVPQGSVLGPLAFVIYINDLDDSTISISVANKFAHDTKLKHRVVNDIDRNILQNCLQGFLNWSCTWCMDFNVKKS